MDRSALSRIATRRRIRLLVLPFITLMSLLMHSGYFVKTTDFRGLWPHLNRSIFVYYIWSLYDDLRAYSSDRTAIIHSSEVLTWITTREGLTSRFFQLEAMHSQAKANNRVLRVVDNVCSHFKDVNSISLCDIFVLPPTIQCTSISPDIIVRKMRCTLPPTTTHTEVIGPPFTPRTYGLHNSSVAYLYRESSFSFNSTLCTLAFGLHFNKIRSNDDITIHFQRKYQLLHNQALISLGVAPTLCSSDSQTPQTSLVDIGNTINMNSDINTIGINNHVTTDTTVKVQLQLPGMQREVIDLAHQNNPRSHVTGTDTKSAGVYDIEATPGRITKRNNDSKSDLLVSSSSSSSSSSSTSYDKRGVHGDGSFSTYLTVVHWRRGDQLEKCKPIGIDSGPNAHLLARDYSVNCGTVKEFIRTVKSILNRCRTATATESAAEAVGNSTTKAYYVSNDTITIDSRLRNSFYGSTDNKRPVVTNKSGRHGGSSSSDCSNRSHNSSIPRDGRYSQRARSGGTILDREDVVYVATNENSIKDLNALSTAGFKLFKDLQFRPTSASRRNKETKKKEKITSVDRFVVELQLMIHAHTFIGFGTTGIRGFVERARSQFV